MQNNEGETMSRLTLDEFNDAREEVKDIERSIIVGLANRELRGLPALDMIAQLEEIKRQLRIQRPIIRRKSKKLKSSDISRLVYDNMQECWVAA